MKKIGVINGPISEVIAKMGHYDMLMLGDAGLPIPPGVRRIDLALCQGVPSFIQTLRVVLSELKLQSVVVASEMQEVSPELYKKTLNELDGVEVELVSHEELKAMSQKAVAVIRTGEFTPYANIILKSGVVF
ncbi:D-ribose pyranase [Anaerosinus gibii]|uniref:D-ribose pyranase n=1 Tax=Selenobaculum gibii TaxID=3054208 RepID=A0A9Y2AHN9_9FIRM|nr:D-ribose pyranase [Selenobaculum gbiensis]WIW70347.1 D-ribose pyranase [Selenobaculum gbiensis]